MKIPNRVENLIGQIFNYFTVIEFDGMKGCSKRAHWICKCTCGTLKSLSSSVLKTGDIKSCGCFRRARASKLNFVDLIGKVFTRLTVRKLDKIKNQKVYWLCQCECGNIANVTSQCLNSGGVKSCGCLQVELARERHTIHGMYGTRFYKIWAGIKERCLNSNSRDYPEYGGKLCERWVEFLNFKADLYDSYLEHVKKFGEMDTSIDRFPIITGKYELSNVRWATREEQSRNRGISPITENYNEHLYWKKKLGSNLISVLLASLQTSPSLEPYLGCTLAEFRKHIEFQFTEGMTWNNHGKGKGKWEYDHIEGINNFDLSKEADRLVCWNYKNLRPLWWEDHLKKSVLRSSEIV
jgi:hypothetical protein